jgi:hypothetical protein
VKDLAKYTREDLDTIFTKLSKMTRVVYSGNVHGLINKVDYRKIMDTHKHLN